MSGLKDKSNAVWLAVKGMVETATQSGGSLDDVKAFYSQRRLRATKLPSPSLIVLERRTQVEEWGAHRGVASLNVVFGFTATSYQPSQSSEELEGLAYSLVDLFLTDYKLGGNAFDTEIVEVNSDASPEGVEETTQPWITVSIAWKFEFLR